MLGINKRTVDALKATPGGLSFSRRSADADTLRHMLGDGSITKLHTPKEIYMMRAEFQKYDLKSFRNGLYALKNETGFNLRTLPETEEAETPPAAAVRPQNADTDGIGDDEYMYDDDETSPRAREGKHDYGPDGVLSFMQETGSWRSFMPMHFLATYKDANQTGHVIVVIVAPSGVCHRDSSKTRVWIEEDGNVMAFMSQWPQPSMDMDRLHNKISAKLGKCASDSDIKEIWKRSAALSDVLALMRGTEEEVLSSNCHIRLPFQVSRRIHTLQLHGAGDGTRLIYVDLKQEESTYKAMEIPAVDMDDDESI